jgi:hypothetical protein
MQFVLWMEWMPYWCSVFSSNVEICSFSEIFLKGTKCSKESVIHDETWVFQYHQETKYQNPQSKIPVSETKKRQVSILQVKSMRTFFISMKLSITNLFFKELLLNILPLTFTTFTTARIRRKRLNIWLHFAPHTPLRVRRFFAMKQHTMQTSDFADWKFFV